jgi:hypothetical protein
MVTLLKNAEAVKTQIERLAEAIRDGDIEPGQYDGASVLRVVDEILTCAGSRALASRAG